ncbi:MAG: hypothetical protein WCC06_06725 [Candidatus Aminicenantales bacterium]
MRKKILPFISIALFISLSLFPATSPQERLSSFERHKALAESSMFKILEWRNLGPYYQGGRICDIEGYASNPHKLIVAAASGGLWLTENNGTTWTPLMDGESWIGFGDVAISEKDPNLIWTGTGEENSSRSSYAGTGIFKSTDGGRTWRHMGLADTHHVADIIIHPENSDIVYVAAIGHLYTENEERGVFKTTDGGKTWAKVLTISPRTGVISLVMHPKNPDILYAAAWQRDRKAWNLVEGGPESAIYKTTDGGLTWRKIVNGFPQHNLVGRIGLAVCRSNPDVVYAFLDNQEPRTEARKTPPPQPQVKQAPPKDGLTIDTLKSISVKDFLKVENGKLESFLRANRAPVVFTAASVKEAVKDGTLTLRELADILTGGANAALFAARVKGAEVYKSSDSGAHWEKTHAEPFQNSIVFSYGYYFGQIYVSPENENVVYILGVPLMKSTDGGKTFEEIPDEGGSYGVGLFDVHPDHHALWINPNNPRHIWVGNDGGLNVSYDAGRTFQKVNNLPLAQCYTVHFDMETPYNIYSGLQDNGVNMGPSNFIFGRRDRDWKMILGGDGAFVQVDPNDPDTVYAEYQFGNIFRLNLKDGQRQKSIKPQAKTVQPPYRFNWLSPFQISGHNPLTLILGANKVLKSVDRGENWIEISPDLTDRLHTDGDVPYATITAIAESPLTPEVFYAGTDDGNVWVTKNSGGHWEKITAGLPKKWVTRIEASRFAKGRVFLAMTGYREDDFRTYVFASEDFGKTWTSIKGSLPEESVNVVREDSANENVLYLGTDLTAYVSVDRGKTWESLRSNLPTQPVYDMRIHPRDKHLIIGTHGRGVFVLPAGRIQQLTPDILAKGLYLFAVPEAMLVPRQMSMGRDGAELKPNARFEFYAAAAGQANIAVKDASGNVLKEMAVDVRRGLNAAEWNLIAEGQKNPVKPGEYQVEVRTGKETAAGTFKVVPFRGLRDF